MKYEVRFESMNYEVLTAAGIATESPKRKSKCVVGLAVDSPAAAERIMRLMDNNN